MERMKFNYSFLRGKIKEVVGTESEFAGLIGISKVSLSGKLNNKIFWNQDEMILTGQVLKIDNKDLHKYFFTKQVKKT